MSDPELQPAEATPDDMLALEEAVGIAGGYAALAKLINASDNAPQMWRRRGAVPQEQAPNIEFAVGGRVSADRLCPTKKWLRVLDIGWPHPQGRPVQDHTRAELKQAA